MYNATSRRSQSNKRRTRKRYEIPESFVQTNFQYVVSTKFNVDIHNPDQRVIWDYIELVIFSPDEEYNCPVCFEIPCAPKMAPCGHIFCYPCLIHIFRGFDVSSSGKMLCKDLEQKCPMCNEFFELNALRSVEIRYQELNKDEEQEFILLKRHKSSTISVNASDPLQDNVPYHNDSNSPFCRFQLLDLPLPNLGYFGLEAELLKKEKIQLISALPDIGYDEKLYYELALERTICRLQHVHGHIDDPSWDLSVPTLAVPGSYSEDDEETSDASAEDVPDSWEDIESSVYHSSESVNQNSQQIGQKLKLEETAIIKGPKAYKVPKSSIYYYQHVSGRKIFIQQESMRVLRKNHGNCSYAHLPARIKHKITSSTTISIDRERRLKLQFLNHLPLTSACVLCTIN